MEKNEKKELQNEQLKKVKGGYFVVNGADTDKRRTTGDLTVTVSHYCKACSHSWTADHADTVCPSCGSTDLYTVVI